MTDTTAADTASSMFKKRGPKGLRRKRPAESATFDDNNGSDSDSETVVIQKSQRLDRGNPLVQGTTITAVAAAKRGRWRESIEEEEKTARKQAADKVADRELNVTYSARQTKDDSATKAREDATRSAWDIQEEDPQAQAIIKQALLDAETDGNELYKGQSGYRNYQTERDAASASKNSGGGGFTLIQNYAGPMRAPANIRVTCRFDYQPDICKDYKETGFCGYGDSCKFMHDRGDYKSGWQLDKEWDEAHSSIANGGDPNEFLVESDSEEEIPFACLICRQPFDKPVVTKCGHYFCQKCALKRYAKTPKCMACGGPTSGVFKTAVKVLEKMREKQRRQQEEKQKHSDNEEDHLLDSLPIEVEESDDDADDREENDSEEDHSD
ncbi:hypothetical protein BDF19DRAFT_453356 [Syncephalis fuscata]|nr:hypothetical protein BDF19DRAFT_453356 [Syncephalis fuscata]